MELGTFRNYRQRRHGKSPATRRECAMRQKIRDLAKRGWAIKRPGVKVSRRPAAAAVAALGLMIAMPASAMTRTTASAAGRPAYLNANLSTQARVSDLLSR